MRWRWWWWNGIWYFLATSSCFSSHLISSHLVVFSLMFSSSKISCKSRGIQPKIFQLFFFECMKSSLESVSRCFFNILHRIFNHPFPRWDIKKMKFIPNFIHMWNERERFKLIIIYFAFAKKWVEKKIFRSRIIFTFTFTHTLAFFLWYDEEFN